MTLTDTMFSQLGTQPGADLDRFDRFWRNYRSQPLPDVVGINSSFLGNLDFDVAIAGGTLGIIVGYGLQQLGWRVVVIEKGILQGRVQEWNISRQELGVLEGLLSPEELEAAIATEYNPGRIGFRGGRDIWVRDVLNLGVSPRLLLAQFKQKFLWAGGRIVEQTLLQKVVSHPNGIEIYTERSIISARLLLDAMGHFSAIATQARQNLQPDGICLVVGSCAKGLPQLDYGDLFYGFTPSRNACQYFWEAFPAQDGRTTYMFTYGDLHPDRPSFRQLFEDYFCLLPQYQGIDLVEISLQRVLYGFFPSWRSPLPNPWDRILPVGDSSGSQSPLSFGGFGALLRHLPRLLGGIDQALAANLLSAEDLSLLQPYLPNLAVTWLFQEAMRIKVGTNYDPEAINKLLSLTFGVMENLGDRILQPFLQDVVQFPALTQTLVAMAMADPEMVAKVALKVGVPNLVAWFRHYINLGVYDLGDRLGCNLAPLIANLLPEHQYALTCYLNRCKYGSGRDYDQ